jgi:hypothetical protein
MNQTLTEGYSFVFCFAISALYVGSLYLIPSSVRKLSRDNETHVSSLSMGLANHKYVSLIVYCVYLG